MRHTVNGWSLQHNPSTHLLPPPPPRWAHQKEGPPATWHEEHGCLMEMYAFQCLTIVTVVINTPC